MKASFFTTLTVAISTIAASAATVVQPGPVAFCNNAHGQYDGALCTSPVLSAFFGDELLVNQAFLLCPPPTRAAGLGGMPIVFSEPIDTQGGFAGQPIALNPAFFRVWVNGTGYVTPTCATLKPAIDGTELRTVLLAGEFGYGGASMPERIVIIGPVVTTSGRSLQGFEITSVDPTNGGARLVLAERFAVADGRINTSIGNDTAYCPVNETAVVVKLTFSGGVTGMNGASLLDDQVAMGAIEIMGTIGNGTRFVINPFALRDIDGDNHLDACFPAPALNVTLSRVAVNGNVFYSPSNAASPSLVVDIMNF